MALTRNMTRDEILAFIDQELLPQAKLEIKNLIKPYTNQGGYFVVVRQVLCMVDFLGATYSGYSVLERKNDPRGEKISMSKKAVKYINSFFKPKNVYKLAMVDLLYKMYRHGLVHLYQPRILKYKNRGKLMWFFYKGKRFWLRKSVDTNQGKIIFKNVDHLQIITQDSKNIKFYLAVCIDALYEDFEKSVQLYRDKLAKTKTLQTRWRTAVNAICKPR